MRTLFPISDFRFPICGATRRVPAPRARQLATADFVGARDMVGVGNRQSAILRLANSSEPAPLQFIGAANALELDAAGWVTIPYGEHRHSGQDGQARANDAAAADGRRVDVIQRFTRESAQRLANEFTSVWSRIKRAFTGLPLFKGHPDAPRFATMFPDKRERGVIAEMQVGDAGLRVKPVLTPQGAADVEAGWSFLSPYWDVIRVGNAADGAIIAEPFKLHSIGLVQRGNIAGISLTNASAQPAPNPHHQENTTMPQWLIDLLIGAGLLKPGQAAEDTARTALANHLAAHNTLVAARDALQTTVTTLTGEKTALANAAETEKTRATTAEAALTTRATTAEAALKDERKERALLLVNMAIAEGRVPAAEKDTKVTALCNAADFAAEVSALAKLPKQLKTRSSLANLAAVSNDATARQQQVAALVNAHIESAHCDYDTAFNAVKAAKPELFAAMKKSESAVAAS